jgi:hypothetical protein
MLDRRFFVIFVATITLGILAPPGTFRPSAMHLFTLVNGTARPSLRLPPLEVSVPA